MTSLATARLARGAAILSAVLVVAVTGCGDKRAEGTADTGAAAPATVRDMSATPNAPDSTAGVANPTGRPASAGDTMGARARDSSKGPSAGSPVGSGAPAKP
jgi:hypothetical protein